jgi:cob(I)alamin adenosyltransferase
MERINEMTAEADNLTRLERDLRFILRHLQAVEGNFETVDELSRAAHNALDTLEEMRLDSQPASDPEAEFTVPVPREPEAADLADAALLVARTVGRGAERVRGFVI